MRIVRRENSLIFTDHMDKLYIFMKKTLTQETRIYFLALLVFIFIYNIQPGFSRMPEFSIETK